MDLKSKLDHQMCLDWEVFESKGVPIKRYHCMLVAVTTSLFDLFQISTVLCGKLYFLMPLEHKLFLIFKCLLVGQAHINLHKCEVQ